MVEEEGETQEVWCVFKCGSNALFIGLRQGVLAAANTYPPSCEECTHKMFLQGVLAAASYTLRSCEGHWATTMIAWPCHSSIKPVFYYNSSPLLSLHH